MSIKKDLELTATPVVSASTVYASGDNVGGLMKLKATSPDRMPDTQYCRIVSIIVHDKSTQAENIDVYLYKSNPSGSTFTDNVAQTLTDADNLKVKHVENLTSYDSAAANGLAGATSLSVGMPFTDGIYASFITRGTPTYDSTSDLTLTVSIEWDE